MTTLENLGTKNASAGQLTVPGLCPAGQGSPSPGLLMLHSSAVTVSTSLSSVAAVSKEAKAAACLTCKWHQHQMERELVGKQTLN